MIQTVTTCDNCGEEIKEKSKYKCTIADIPQHGGSCLTVRYPDGKEKEYVLDAMDFCDYKCTANWLAQLSQAVLNGKWPPSG